MRPPSLLRSITTAATPATTSSFLSYTLPESPGHLHLYLRQLLQTSVRLKDLRSGSQIHATVVTNGLQRDSFLSTLLVTIYSLCGNAAAAASVFNRVPDCSVYLLNAMVRGFVANGLHHPAIDVFRRKRVEGDVLPDSHTFSCILKACASLPDLRRGREVHGLVLVSGFDSDVFVCNSLVCMYAKCGRLDDGVRVFDKMSQRDIVSWNSVILAYAWNGLGVDVMVKLRELVGSGLRMDGATVVSVLGVCSSGEAVREVHCYVVRNGLELASTVRNALLSAYGKNGKIREVGWLFNNTVQVDKVSWNALISCYAQQGMFEESMELLSEMKRSGFDADAVTYSGIISSFAQNDRPDDALSMFKELLNTGSKLDAVTIASVLPAISDLRFHEKCRELHGHSYRHGLETDRRIRNALVSAYCKCGSVESSSHVFESIQVRDVISWSSMVAGFAQNGYFNEAIAIFRQMASAGIEPNPITITSILSACAGVSRLKQGKEVHCWSIRRSLDDQTFVGSTLIDMYAKCGGIKASRRVFDLVKEKNLVTWNSMIGGYAVHGLTEDALDIFRSVKEPDEVTFIAALSACSHGGLVKEGIEIFNSMKDFNLKPREGHYACMVDILGRSGRLDEALNLVKSMPMAVTVEIWGSILGSCKVHSNLEMGIYSGEQIIGSGSDNPGYYVLLSNILADFRRWGDVEAMRKVMVEKGVKKVAGCSWIELDQEVHSFVARDRRRHPEWESLLSVLRQLDEQMKTMSYNSKLMHDDFSLGTGHGTL